MSKNKTIARLVDEGMSPHFFLVLLAATSLVARIIPENYVFSEWMKDYQSSEPHEFEGLSWQLAGQWSCERKNDELLCHRGLASNALRFKKFTLLSREAGPLVRLLRKQEWQKNKLIQYVEEPFTSPLGNHIQSIGQVLEYNNIVRPVLLKAFDVVLDEKTCISITSQCTVSDCPMIEKEVREMVSSLKKTARK